MSDESPSMDSGRPAPAPAPADPEFEDLLSEVLHRVHAARDEEVRWRLLLDAVVAMSADLSLDHLLRQIVRLARDLVGARYAALGVLGTGSDDRLRMFLTEGLTGAETAAIGDLPRGEGLLGLVIDQPEPLRLHDIAAHPRSVGFPEHHPPMRSFLGVPIRTRGKGFGNLYLTEKIGEDDFSAEDERVAVALAAAAGVAIDNVLLHDEVERRQRWLSASAEITTGLMTAADAYAGLQLVADKAREAAGADLAWIITGPDARRLRLRVAAGIDVTTESLEAVPLEESIAGAAVRTGLPVTTEDMSRDRRASGFGVLPIKDLGPVMMFPLREVDSSDAAGTHGVLALAWRHENAEAAQNVDLALPAAFAEQAALAITLARARARAERLAVYEDRDRIGRDLHDVVIQRLFATGLSLQGTRRRTEDPEVDARLDEAVQDIDETIAAIRRTIFELGSTDDSADLQTQARQVVDRAATALKFRPSLVFEGPIRLRVDPAIVPDAVAVLGEALSNTTRHAHASHVDVLVGVAGDALTVRVVDDGIGIPTQRTESGLANMRERADRLGGRCTIGPGPLSGTTLEWSVPLR
jgi:signal transduction histidine kinase